ncbi:MAG: methylated-DNA--[protein]-cysteine S-methyltransferase [Anaerolineales bacterium]|nr:methylated-DNA--[protein]-cysteine S-methyltransferase [Anaerolineales bacterium]
MSTMSQTESQREIWLGDREGLEGADSLLVALDRVLGAAPGPAVTQRAVEQVRERLAAGRSPVYYDVLPDTPIGPVYVLVGAGGLAAVEIGGTEAGFVAQLRRKGGGEVIRSGERARQVTAQIEEYFRGEREVFDCPVDLSQVTSFHRQVLLAAARIPRGSVMTYGGLARALGKPRAARAVGRALATNPVPLVIPCHRVIASDGSLGGYSASDGVSTKLRLLRFEGAPVAG